MKKNRLESLQRSHERLGTRVLIGTPPKPLSKRLIRRISEIICDIEEIREAHLPEVIAIGSDNDPIRVLFLVFAQTSRISTVMESIAPKLSEISRGEISFEVWPIGLSNSLLTTIRNADCLVGWRD